MASLSALKNYYGATPQIGKQIKADADRIMDETFDLDVTTRLCYIYDYFHDDVITKDICEYGKDYTPPIGSAKIPVKLKFLIKSYKSLSKDDPEYYIQFTMSDWNKVIDDPDNQTIIPEYFTQYKRFGVHYPVGLYVDIPDDRGVYWRWLVVYEDVANQFPKFGVVRCNYQLDWIANNKDGRFKRAMWGAQRTQSSYNSGIYSFDKTTVMEMQSKFWLPWNSISNEIFYNQRIILSMPMEIPLTWQISKIENTTPRGVVMITIYQDTFNPKTDYIDKSEPTHWRMYADYYKFPAEPETDESQSQVEEPPKGSGTVTSTTALFKIGGTWKTLTANFYNEDGEEIVPDSYAWAFRMGDGTDATFLVETKESTSNNKIKVKFLGDESYVGKQLIATCLASGITGEESFDIIFM